MTEYALGRSLYNQTAPPDTLRGSRPRKVYAFNLSCPHQNTALRWYAEDGQFQCPKHHSRYRPDGVFISGRATRSMDRLGIRRDGATVVVDVDKFYRQDKNPAEWAAAVLAV